MAAEQASVDVIIVNYRTPFLTMEAVRSVLGEPEVHEVLVVENSSGDDSLSIFRSELEGLERVRLIESERNLGFGGGNNLAAGVAAAPILFLLNSDAVLEPGGLGRLCAVLDELAVGMVQPMVLWPGRKRIQQPGMQGRFPTAWTIINRSWRKAPLTLEPHWISGVALLVRREQFLSLGGFSGEFFMYFEDTELCWRYHKAGLRMAMEPTAVVIHHEGQSKNTKLIKQRQFYRSMDTYLRLTGASAAEQIAVKAARAPYMLLQMLRGKYR